MTKAGKGIPEGFHSVTPYLTVKEASKVIQFYKDAFGAIEIERNNSPDGRIMNAVIKIGDSYIMLSDVFHEYDCGVSPPHSLKGTTMMLHIYHENVDAAFDKAIKAGCKVKMPVADMFWGDRYGQLEDPFGHIWSIATHKAEAEQHADQCCHGSCKSKKS